MKFFLTSVCLLLSVIATAQNVNFAWAKQMGGPGADEDISSVATDVSGNVYITGGFSGTVDFDPGPGVFNLSTAAIGDIFITKLNAAGDFIWAKQMGGTGYCGGRSVAVDAAGNVYTTGSFYGMVDFDPGPGTFNLIAPTEDLFISKLDSSGNFIWAKQIGGTINDRAVGRSIVVDASGNVYTTGDFAGYAVDFNPGPGVYILTSNYGARKIFVSKLDAAGNFVWAKQMVQIDDAGAGIFGSYSNSIAVDGSGNVYTTGRFAGTVDFDPGTGAFYLSTVYGDNFISKLDASGNFVWAKQMASYSSGNSIAIGGSGNVYTTGYFIGTTDFDPGPGIYYLTAFGSADIFISKLDASGNFIWAKQLGGTGDNNGYSVAVDASGNVYTTGYFTGTTDFDPGPGTYNLTSFGSANYFISKLNASGNFIWAKQLGGMGGIGGFIPNSIAVDADENVYTTGKFADTVDFDPGPGTYNLTSFGNFDAFIHKMSRCTNGSSSTIAASACNSYTLNGQAYNTSGVYTQTLTNAAGCDSIITLNLTINSSAYIILNATACDSYLWNGQIYSSSGTYKDTIVTFNGCDSIITLNLLIKPKAFSAVNAAICAGQNYFGHTTTGTYIDTLVAVNGCDSVRTLDLIVNPGSFSSVTPSICQGQSFAGYKTSGTYIDTLLAANGCDSIRTINLTVKPGSFSTISQSMCSGQIYLGHSSGGTYIDTLVASNGCDSIRTLHLTVLPKPSPYLGADTLLCAGDSLQLYPGQFTTYTWQNGSAQSHLTIKQPGLYAVTVTDNCGSANDEILVKEGICDIYFPSAFTPNNDGKNDWFKVLGDSHLNDYHLVVYNRWGQKVFETKDHTKGWTGKLNGRLLDTGVFIWYCEFKKSGNNNIVKIRGTVVLIR